MNKFQKNLTKLIVMVILLFVYAVNFNIFNELFLILIITLKQYTKPKFVETLESN